MHLINSFLVTLRDLEHLQLTLNISNTWYLKLFGFSNKGDLGPLTNNQDKKLLGTLNSRYIKQFSDPLKSLKYRELTL